MTGNTPLMRRYLLAELSEVEQAELEARYFEDPHVFDELVETEHALIDDYVRGRLTPETRRRFETAFMADPRRRERVRFAAALTKTIDGVAAAEALDSESGRTKARAGTAMATAGTSWLESFGTLRFAVAIAGVVALVAGGMWLVFTTPPPNEQVTVPAPDERRRVDGSSPMPSGVPDARPSASPPAANEPASVPRPVLAVATLALVVGPGERSAAVAGPPTLSIPPGTSQVRFALTLREPDYARYRVIVRAIGGAEVLRQGDLVPPSGGAEPALTITAPAAGFEPGDYMLTLQGAAADGEYEDLSQTIFQIKQP